MTSTNYRGWSIRFTFGTTVAYTATNLRSGSQFHGNANSREQANAEAITRIDQQYTDEQAVASVTPT